MTIAYKVVVKKSRESCFAPKPFSLAYHKGKTVEAVEGSIGVVCSETRELAEKFMRRAHTHSRYGHLLDVIKVRGIGKGTYISQFIGFFSTDHIKWTMKMIEEHGFKKAIDKIYLSQHLSGRSNVVCFKSVEVLE